MCLTQKFSLYFVIFVVLSGIWDVLSNEEVVDFVRCRIAQGMKPDMVRTCRLRFTTSLLTSASIME